MIPVKAAAPHTVETRFPPDARVVHSISLGAGVQSTTLYLMAAHGLVRPTPDAAIFADTRWEPPDIYQHLEWLQSIQETLPFPIPIHVVSAGDIYHNVWHGLRASGNAQETPWTDVPNFTINSDGSHGISSRQCTQNYKIKPIIAHLRKIAERPPGRRHTSPPFAVQWIGISLDEWQRMKDARDGWVQNVHPLVEMRMTRHDCRRWFEEHYPGRPLAKSACVGCPYHSNHEWLRIYRKFPEEAERAVLLDEHLREPERMQLEPNESTLQFLHQSRKPLREVLNKLDHLERIQPRLLDDNEPSSEMCGGHCYTFGNNTMPSVIGYAYDADRHCVPSTKERFPPGADNDEHTVPMDSTDAEGNLLKPMFSSDEVLENQYCGECRDIIAEA